MTRDKKPYNILVVEDNSGDFTIVDDFLREQILNPFIVHAVNYKQALSILSESDIVFDIILLDLSLPDKSGQNLITEMLFLAPSCPIIVLTGYTDIDFSIKSISQGIYDYLLKDELNATSLYKSIIYAIERKKTISELKSSEKRASDLFNLSPQPMMVYDQETYRFIQVNKAAIEHYGFSKEEFLDITLMDISPADDSLKTQKNSIDLIAKSDDAFKGKFIHRKKSGDLIDVEIFSNPVMIDNKIFRSVIAIDVTEKNLYEGKIMKAIIKTQEDERYEIGGELHDNVCQLVAISQLSLGMLKKYVDPGKMSLFDQSKEHLARVLYEIRNLSHRLAPAFFDDSTLEEAFNRLLNTFNMEEKFKIQLHFDNAVKNYPVSLEIQINLYRILQEQLRNIQKYANADLIEVDVILYNNRLMMKVADNGFGFDVKKVKDGIGLANMKRRTELFSGKFELESSPGNGCTVVVDIPL
ncbi:MAG: response regulator [Ferruginibacter sp.]